ncbi:MAG TPA: PLP-dependent aspartate aminotransferase family protein [Bryobacteraceae bacterium]|nr:PLP-dependent aspartate aminotransferase family protein [Bryobacteraceae bacterium]
MKIETKAVHKGDRKRSNVPGAFVPSSTPIYTATTYLYEETAKLDRVLGHEEEGFSYGRYDNPTRLGLEELLRELEGGANAQVCSSGMAALHLALLAALTDRRKSVLLPSAIYGSTVTLLQQAFEPLGVEVNSVDVCDLAAVERKIAETKPGCVVMETISNPLLRMGDIDRVAELARAGSAALIVDNTFASPLLVRPMEHGANMVVESLTKFLSGHGDVLGGVVVSDNEHADVVRALARTLGPTLSPFESFLAMRGIKTFALRVERQCANACRVASWLESHPRISRVHYLGDPKHPDAAVVRKLLPEGLHGALVAFEIRDASKEDVLHFMDKLQLVVCGTSLGDVHSLMSYPVISSHREIAPKQRARLGIGDGLVRFSVGIEAVDDITADLDQALA